ncbi:MAG: ABC transporter permease [Pseudomonadota bacterium]
MNAALLLRMAVSRLLRFRLQTILMSVGIVISVCATVLVAIALVNTRDRFTVYFGRIYPTDSIMLATESGDANWTNDGERLTIKDIETIRASITEIVDWDPLVFGGQRVVKIGPNATTALIIGNSERAERIRDRSVSEGEYFTEADVRTRARVVLLGSSIAAVLFPDGSPIGQQVSIDGISFTVKGVLDRIGLDPHGNDQDDVIQIPYTTLMEQVMKVDAITSATLVLSDPGRMKDVAERVSAVLHEIHPYDAAHGESFHIVTPVDIQQRLDESFSTIKRFVALASAIGFALSGIVIAMVMVMSVKSRTSEIGLRKALGARARDVHWQLTIEAVVVVAAASLFGLLLAKAIIVASAPYLAERFGLVMSRAPFPILAATILAAVVTAVLSALLVARRAAKLDPVVALRQQ